MTAPETLPVIQIIRNKLLIRIIQIFQTAVNTLIEIAAASSGQTGCARAGEREVSILLGALQNDSQVVRDAALRGLLAMKEALEPENKNLVRTLR